MDFTCDVAAFMSLPGKVRRSVINTLQEADASVTEYAYVPIPDEVDDESSSAKEYFRQSGLRFQNWAYSSLNWKQAYTYMMRDGLIKESENGLLMKLPTD